MKTTQLEQAKALAGNRYFFGVRKSDGSKIYLSAPSWDCGWYWGFGYLGNKNEHYHLDSFYKSKDFRDTLLKDYKLNPCLEGKEWEFCELVRTAYSLKEAAEVLGRGGSHYTTNPCQSVIVNKAEVKRINEVVLPAIFLAIDQMFMDEKETSEETELKALAKMGVTVTMKHIGHDYHFDGDKDQRDIYRVTFRRGRNSFSVKFGQSIANTGKTPKADEIFECLTKSDPGTYQDFVDNYGVEDKKMYRAICEEWEKVNSFFTETELMELENV